ncbi:deoxyribodipyrimidine photo-lyase [bacterium]|nr:deoxyribodipyrimidine photo-lyase [bacterium]
MSNVPIIVWFRNDLRLADQPALHAAHKRARSIVPVFIWSPDEEGEWPPGGASQWWLHHSLASLDESLKQIGSRLIIRSGPALDELQKLIKETGASTVLWNRRYEPGIIERDTKIKTALTESGIEVESFNATLLHEPWTIQNKSGKPFQVFTPFWKTCLAKSDPPPPLPAPKSLKATDAWPKSVHLDELNLLPKIPWDAGMRSAWTPGEAGAGRSLKQFIADHFADYTGERNRPDRTGTSRLSPHLHFGEISPRQVWYRLKNFGDPKGNEDSGSAAASPCRSWRNSQFLAEIGWREFAYHLLFHFPHTTREPLRPEFNRFPWREDDEFLDAWQKGGTGYPFVDAGMRELWTTGWMHNRVRMVVGSFLVKDLLIDWRAGASWFWDTLVDADLASNTLGWQWTAGCGADAAPYFRVFNPIGQGEKFDPNGDYVRRWVPELAKLPTEWIHKPFDAPDEVLRAAGVKLGGNYPEPIVNHAIARQVALEAYGKLKS